MFLAKVIGQVVSTKKEPPLQGVRLLILRPMLVDESNPAQLKPGSNTIVAVDKLGAGKGQMVLLVQGSSARQCEGMKTIPVDAAVAGIVDSVQVGDANPYSAGDS